MHVKKFAQVMFTAALLQVEETRIADLHIVFFSIVLF